MRGLRHLLGALWYGTDGQASRQLQTEARSFTSPENPSTSLDDPAQWLIEGLGGGSTRTGVQVTPTTAMTQSAVFACVRNIAEDMAVLPLHVFGTDKKKLVDDPVYALLHDQPNPLQTSFTWRQMAGSHVQLWGNAYSEIEIDGGGRPLGFWPIPPWLCDPYLIDGGQDVVYRVQLPDRVAWIPSYRMLHVPGIGFDGIKGKGMLSFAREAIGLGLAGEQYGSAFFGNASRPSGYLKVPPTVAKEKAPDILKEWNRSNQGLDNVGRTTMLLQGAEWQKIALTNEEAQFTDLRKMQITDIARFWRMPPSMIGDLERSTFANNEQQALQYVVHTLTPWLVRFEQEYKRKLFGGRTDYAKHAVQGLARGDMAARTRYYATGRQWGWLCVDDIRELEEQPPLPDGAGQVYLQPVNMADARDPVAGDNPGGAKEPGEQMPGTQTTTN